MKGQGCPPARRHALSLETLQACPKYLKDHVGMSTRSKVWLAYEGSASAEPNHLAGQAPIFLIRACFDGIRPAPILGPQGGPVFFLIRLNGYGRKRPAGRAAECRAQLTPPQGRTWGLNDLKVIRP